MGKVLQSSAAMLVFVILPSAQSSALEPVFRRPTALAASSNCHQIYTANRGSGTISVIDLNTQSVTGEIPVGGRLTDVVTLDNSHLLTVDRTGNRLVMLTRSNDGWVVADKLELSPDPVRLAVNRLTSQCFVTSSWSRTVTVVEIPSSHQKESVLKQISTFDLSFEPHEIILLPNQRIVVTSTYQAHLAVIDTEQLELIREQRIPGHNIRGLAVSSDGTELLVAHQELSPIAHTDEDDVHWGNLMSNLLVSYSIDDLCEPTADLLDSRRISYLGGPGRAASDPGPISIGPNDELAVLASGVNEVAIGRHNDSSSLRHVSVGRTPSAILRTPAGSLIIANTYSDSLSIVPSASDATVQSISLGAQPEPSPKELGEMLFHDGRLSMEGWMSCHSCHTDGHTNGQFTDNLTDHTFGSPKRVLSLLGVSDTSPWGWNGEIKSLEEQVHKSVQTTMRGPELDDSQVAALVSYIKTLPPPPSQLISNINQLTQIARGREVFESLNCQKCHAPPAWTTPAVWDVGLQDEFSVTEFNPPSLRGVGRRKQLFHDGRATSLQDVIMNHKHQVSRDIPPDEYAQLITFLKSL